jgi:large subunit ribosomal protein L24
MKFKKGDKVKVIAGKFKGTESTIEKVLTDANKVIVKDVNVFTKHIKPTRNSAGSIDDKFIKPIDASNIMLIDAKSGKPTRIGYKMVDGKKYRVSKKSGELIDKK